MNLLFQAAQTKGLNGSYRKTSSSLSWLIVFALVLAISAFLSTSTLSAHESPIYYDTCDDVTDAGTIAGDQTGCGDPLYDPDIIISTSPATGGSSALEYLWMSTTDDPNGNSSVWNIIPGTNSESYDPGPISQTTSYRRCARRAGCVLWINESNFVTVELDCSLPSIGDTVFFDENGNGIQDNNEAGVAGVMVKLLDAGPDGVFGTGDENIVSTVTTNSNGEYLFVDVDPGTYIIEFMSNSLPDGFTFTTQNIGNDANDSDADSNGQTDPFTVNFGDDDDLTFDAGLISTCTLQIQAITGVNPMCNPGNTGIVALSVTGGTTPYTYIWSNGATTEDINGLPAGDYCVTITDGNGCTVSDCATLTAPNPISASANFSPEVCGQSDGSIDLSVTGGTGSYTYQWNNGATTQDLNNLPAGTYCVVITDANGCNISECYVIGATGNNTVFITPNNSTICPGQTINLNASGSANSTYSWSATGGFFNTIVGQNVEYTVFSTGVHTITVSSTSAAGCVATTTTTVTVNQNLSIGGSADNTSCNENNGSVNTTISGGAAPISYTWNTGQSTASISNLAPGTYCVTATDVNGCSNNACFSVTSSNPATVSISGPNAICPGETINLSANSTNASTYSWSATGGSLGSPSGQNTSYTMMIPGTYTITVNTTNAQGCLASANTTVTVYQPVNIAGTVNNAACGVNNGSIGLTLSSGTGPFSYNWSTGATTQGISNLAPGNYCVTVTDANGCQDSECFNVNGANSTPVTISGPGFLCPGESINLSANSADAVSYSWTATGGNLASPNAQNTTYTMMVPGTYTITVISTNSAGCTSSDSHIVLVYEPIIISNANVTDAGCGINNGAISISTSSGIAPFSYAWSNGATTQNISSLAPGNYCVTINDAVGCHTTTECYTVNASNATPVTISGPTAICPGESINLSANSADAVSYSWTATGGTLGNPNGQNTSYTMMVPGTYTITVNTTNSQGCMTSNNTTVTVYQPVNVSGTVNDADCGLNNGSINLSIASGSAPFTYIWNTGATTQTISNLAAGTFCVTVGDSNGCQDSECFTVNASNATPVTISGPNAICPGESINLSANSADAVSYSWTATGGSLGNPNGQNTSYTMMVPGTYTITVNSTNSQGCTASNNTTVTVYQPAEIAGTINDADCGVDNGYINLTISSGTVPFTYDWSNGATTQSISNLAPDDYCVTVTDNNGCQSSECFTVDGANATPVVISGPTAICPGESINLSANSADAVSYSWTATGGSLGNPNGQNTSYTMMVPGTYTITVNSTNSQGCTSSANTSITVYQAVNIAGTVDNAACGVDDGSISLSLNSGSAPFTYDWSNGATTQGISNLGAGTFCVTVTDGNGCQDSECFTVNGSNATPVTISGPAFICPGESINFTANSADAVNYSWTATAGNFTNPNAQNTGYTTMGSGTITITVVSTNSAGCTSIASTDVLIFEPIILSGTVTNANCGQDDGSIITSITSGIAPFTYSWSTGQTTPNIDGLIAGEYCVTVTDNVGCHTATECFTIGGSEAAPVMISGPTTICPGETIDLTAVSTDAIVFDWTATAGMLGSPSAQTTTYSWGIPGDYVVTVNTLNAEGCIGSASTTITVNEPVMFVESIIDTQCGEDNGSIDQEIISGAAPFTYAWSTGANTRGISNLPAGQYCITVTDLNGCENSECYLVQSSSNLAVLLDVSEITCDDLGTISAQVSGGLAPFTYQWNTGQTTGTITNLVAGEYCVMVTDANGCQNMQCTTLDPVQATVVSGTVVNPTCDSNNGSITTDLDPNINVTYIWSTGQTTPNLSNLVAGDYTVTVTSVDGCTSIESFTLISEGELELFLTPMNPLCAGLDNGIVTSTVNFTGSGSLIYSWSNGAVTPDITDLPAGDYCLTVTSTDGCEAQECVTLTAPQAVNANAFISGATCNNEDGKIKLTVSGGTAPYKFDWSNGATTEDIEDLAPGEYCVVICDANGCTFEGCFTVVGGVNFNTTIQANDITCNGADDGSATATTDGGSSPFIYIWNTGATTSTISNLPAGLYCVTVTDRFGCSDEDCVTITEPAPINISTSSSNTTCSLSNGSATVSFGFTASSVTWTGPGVNANTNTIDNLAAGTYTVQVVSQEGCIATDMVTINPSDPLDVTIAPTNAIICPDETVSFTSTTNSGGTSYAWTATGGSFSSATSANPTYTNMVPGTYTIALQATNALGCTDTEIVAVTVRDSDDPICNPNVDLVNIGDFVWFDINNNGIQDPGELGIEGVEVKLMTTGPDGIFYTADDVTIASEFTDPMGFYLFENVAAGDYIIMFCIDTFPGTEFTTQDTGGNDGLDSDANPINGKTDPFTVIAGQDDDLSFDAGIILSPTGCDNITKAGDICCDQVLCGAGSVPDLITNTTLPSGGSGAIEYIWMSTTLGGPFNMATWNVIPGATGAEYQPGPIFETTFIARCARRAGCENYFETSIITLEVVASPTVYIASLPAFICVGESDNFNSSDAGFGGTYSWDLGQDANPATATGQFLTNVSWSTAGAKTITLTTTNSAGCIFELTRTVTVGNCLAQPISDRFIDFSITPMEESMDVDLNWNTNEDMNDFHFVVEHSAEGEDFEIIYSMDGNKAYENKNYNYLDESARPGRNYYRIKHINNNGQTEISETQMVILSDSVDKFILFPNPALDYVIFESLRLTDEEGVIVISDMKGMIIDQIIIPPNTERMRINVSNLSPGSYVLYTKYIDIRSIPQIIFKSEK